MNIMRDNAERFIETIHEFIRLEFQLSDDWTLPAVSHQLKGPLPSVYGFAELLLTGTSGKLRNDHRQMIVFIKQSMDTIIVELQQLVDEMRGGTG